MNSIDVYLIFSVIIEVICLGIILYAKSIDNLELASGIFMLMLVSPFIVSFGLVAYAILKKR